ncbi:MAG: deoxyribodipyrimidine photo-lyase [Bacteroidota bacterium]
MTIFWHRRDLRTNDNAGLYRALKNEGDVLPIFIFDRNILDKLEDKSDARVEFLQSTVSELVQSYGTYGGSMRVFYGYPKDIWARLIEQYPNLRAVYANEDYESYAMERDQAVAEMLAAKDIGFNTYKDHVIFADLEVQKKDGGPYTVFTPYSRMWRTKLESRLSQWVDNDGTERTISYYLKPYATEKYFDRLLSGDRIPPEDKNVPSLADMGFEATDIEIPPTQVSRKIIREYDKTRNIPGIEGTSRLGIHFRHGTISIREKCLRAMDLNATYVNELIWRDF